MGKKSEIIYSDEYMQDIIKDYQECITIIQEIRNNNAIAKTAIIMNYKGEARIMTEVVFDEIKKHLEFLETCCESMQEYVQNAWDTMRDTNKALAGGSHE